MLTFNPRWIYFEELVGDHHWERIPEPYELPYNGRKDHLEAMETLNRLSVDLGDVNLRIIVCQALTGSEVAG